MNRPVHALARTLPFDALAGLTVAIVALPLALAFGVTTGVGSAAGITTAIVAGAIAGIFGGSNMQVSGPTGAMTVILVPIVAAHGAAALVPIGVLAGGLLILAGVVRLGRFMEHIPWSVMEGFTLGIAVVIAAQQLPFALATTMPEHGGTVPGVIATLRSTEWDSATFTALLVVAVTLCLKWLWRRFQARTMPNVHIPASIIAITVVTAGCWILKLPVATVGEIRVDSLFEPHFDISGILSPQLIWAAITVAALGGIESLLSARVADAMLQRRDGSVAEPHRPNRELFGQGLATLASALFGGMPATGAIARTSVNVHAGARTRRAAVLHAVFLLIFVLALSDLVAQIPLAALAAVLLATSWRIASPESVRENLRTTWVERLSYLATALAVVCIDLILGIIIGIVIHTVATRGRNRSKPAESAGGNADVPE